MGSLKSQAHSNDKLLHKKMNRAGVPLSIISCTGLRTTGLIGSAAADGFQCAWLPFAQTGCRIGRLTSSPPMQLVVDSLPWESLLWACHPVARKCS